MQFLLNHEGIPASLHGQREFQLINVSKSNPYSGLSTFTSVFTFYNEIYKPLIKTEVRHAIFHWLAYLIGMRQKAADNEHAGWLTEDGIKI